MDFDLNLSRISVGAFVFRYAGADAGAPVCAEGGLQEVGVGYEGLVGGFVGVQDGDVVIESEVAGATSGVVGGELAGGSAQAVAVAQAHAEARRSVGAQTVAVPARTERLGDGHAGASFIGEIEFDGV